MEALKSVSLHRVVLRIPEQFVATEEALRRVLAVLRRRAEEARLRQLNKHFWDSNMGRLYYLFSSADGILVTVVGPLVREGRQAICVEKALRVLDYIEHALELVIVHRLLLLPRLPCSFR